MCSLQLLHHSDVPRPMWGIFSLWEPAGGRARGSRCVNIPEPCVNRGLGWHDLPAGQDTSLAQYTAVQGVHCWLCVRMWESSHTVYETSHIHSKSLQHEGFLKCNLPVNRKHECHWMRQNNKTKVWFWDQSSLVWYTVWPFWVYCTLNYSTPLKKEIAF